MCRSDPLFCTSVARSSGSVAILFDRLPRHFLDRRDAFHHLLQSAPAERDHPFVDGLAPQLERRRADPDQLPQLVGDFHHFVPTDAPLVAGVVATLTARSLL